ncbi:hypothetical protein [Deinococcus hohokamensis]|uniref:DUF4138 domain-containing protein n=1 Tax=Deinococcus hohokamensis TaxID=309883 RepID=A0ABV9IF38_9DEIO
MKRLLSLAALLTGLASAQTQTVFINGVALPSTPVQVGGVTYYQFKASDLQRVGALTAGGVKPKIEAVKGCVGDTLFNGVYTVQLLGTAKAGDRFGVILRVSNASKKTLSNFMMFSPSDVNAATAGGSATKMPNYDGPWLDDLLPGSNVTVRTFTGNLSKDQGFTRLLIRPDADAVKELKKERLPLARVYNMEFDLTCKK